MTEEEGRKPKLIILEEAAVAVEFVREDYLLLLETRPRPYQRHLPVSA